ncbi:MAG: double-strand break repair helicase AddA, partial [Caulobacteraceae bacterium]
EAQREAITGYIEACAERGEDVATDVWRACGFEDEPADTDALEQAAVSACEWAHWRNAAHALIATGAKTDETLGRKMAALAECAESGPGFSDCFAVFTTQAGELAKKLGTKAVDAGVREWLLEEQSRLHAVCRRAKAARSAQDTISALTLAAAYGALYEGEKAERGALDFADLVSRTNDLLTKQADAAWVLYKLDGGIDHVLVDEAQDTSPPQWEILRALTGEFFAGAGARPDAVAAASGRTVFGVGDEKQSIYSFQGARPERLALEADYYAEQAGQVGGRFERVPLVQSWRSTPEVLQFVDAVFADPSTLAAVPPTAGDEAVRHVAGREGQAGCVDLWPLFKDEPREEPDAWDAPVDTPAQESARKRLARRIADEIRGMTARGEAVFDKEIGDKGEWRVAGPGDVLILVRRRDGLFEEIIRALKKAGVPVAGADRLKLSDHAAFQDLLALARFALFTSDDLTLAELLRGPLCDLNEESLYDLAQARTGSLWAELSRRAEERADWLEARGFLGWAREQAKTATPFDFYGRVLSRLDASGRSVRQRFLTRLGRESEDALDEFMAQALSAEGRGLHDLERFTAAMERADIQVKRELEAPRGEVRVMTVHGAKGLEAPIVILPDTTMKPQPVRASLLRTPNGGFLFAPRKADDTEVSAAARQMSLELTEQESLRLLYVALTRARDRVIVCGRINSRDAGAPDGGWYQRIEAAFHHEGICERTHEIGEGERTALRFGPDPLICGASDAPAATTAALPAWVRGLAPAEAASARYASPSTVADQARGPTPSPLAEAGGLGRFRRGNVIHKLLQVLPDLPPEQRADGARRLLDKERDLTPDQRAEMADAALAVLNDPLFEPVFGPGSRPEMAVAGTAPDLPAGLAISGRVDRMVVTPGRVLVVDFKTNRPSPATVEGADPAYLMQMAIYVAVLRAVFPGRTVEAALVWTDGPKLMPIPEQVITSTLATLRAQA